MTNEYKSHLIELQALGKEWVLVSENTLRENGLICEHCHKPIPRINKKNKIKIIRTVYSYNLDDMLNETRCKGTRGYQCNRKNTSNGVLKNH